VDTNHSGGGDTLNKKIGKFHCPNYLSTKIDGEVAIPHTFAVIIELTKDTVVKDVNFEFISQTSILWPMGDPYNRTHHKEKFRIGKLQWSTTLSDYDYYINTTNSNDIKTKTPLDSETLAKRTKEYTLVDIHDEQKRSSQTFDDSVSFEQGTPASGQAPPIKETRYKAGLYIFLLPVLFPAHMPATISSINGSLIHNLTVTLNKVSEKLNRRVKVNGNYSLPMVRTPPSFANSIADKPVYVNRVWNDSLHYFITFPRKYVSLGSEHVINIKLVPLVKDVIIKRIKFNILEKITYVSKDLTKEYEYDSEDPFHLKPLLANGKARERVISLCELKTKQKSSNSFFEPFKEEVIKCPDNNLLFTCYKREDQGSSDYIATPLDINIALPFLTTRSDQTLLTANGNEVPTNHIKSRKASIVEDSPNTAIIGTLETNLVHTDHNREDMVVPNVSTYNVEEHATHVPSESMQKGITLITRALYPDSNYRHIQIHHRLQVCFRISKPDPNDNYKVHHYEVVVDTPLILLSAKCNKSSLELPKYDEIESVFPTVSENTNKVTFRTPVYEKNGVSIKPMVDTSDVLPTFEEAVQGPKVRSMSVLDDPLDAVDDFQPLVPPSYEEDCEIYTHLPLIDDMFDSTSDVPSVPGEPRLKNELSSAFAPELRSSSEENIPESIDELSSEEDAIDPAQIDSEDTIATSSESNINSSIRSKPATSISSTSDLNNEEFIMDNVDLIEEEDTKSSQMTGDDIKLDSSRSEDDLSLNTGASSYCEQRLPLLQHCSTDTVTKMNRRPTTLSIQLDISIPVTLNMNSSGNR
jgi:hypothetical protein